MAREVGVPPKILADAVRPVLERIQADEARVPPVPIGKLLRYVREHLFSETFTITEAKRATGIRGNTIVEYCQRALRCSPRRYREERRLDVAERLRELAPELSLERIAEAIGVGSARTLSKALKRYQARRPAETAVEPAAGAEMDFPERLLLACSQAERTAFEAKLAQLVLLPECRRLPKEERRQCLHAPIRLHGPELFRTLLRLSREGCRDDRKLGVEMAKDALEILKTMQGTLGTEELAELEIEGLAWLGQAQVLAIDYLGAHKTLCEAKATLGKCAVPSRLLADVLELEGRLLSAERCHGEALEIFRRACELREMLGEPVSFTRALLAKGFVHEVLGELQQARSDFERAKGLIEPIGDLYLGAAVATRLSNVAAMTGDWEAAGRDLVVAQQLAAKMTSRSVWHRLWWIEGLQAQARVETRRAEEYLIAARVGFRSEGDWGTAAIVALDLAILYDEHGQREDMLALVTEVLPVVEALQLLPDRVEIIRLLRAVSKEQGSHDLLLQARQQLAPR